MLHGKNTVPYKDCSDRGIVPLAEERHMKTGRHATIFIREHSLWHPKSEPMGTRGQMKIFLIGPTVFPHCV